MGAVVICRKCGQPFGPKPATFAWLSVQGCSGSQVCEDCEPAADTVEELAEDEFGLEQLPEFDLGGEA